MSPGLSIKYKEGLDSYLELGEMYPTQKDEAAGALAYDVFQLGRSNIVYYSISVLFCPLFPVYSS